MHETGLRFLGTLGAADGRRWLYGGGDYSAPLEAVNARFLSKTWLQAAVDS